MGSWVSGVGQLKDEKKGEQVLEQEKEKHKEARKPQYTWKRRK